MTRDSRHHAAAAGALAAGGLTVAALWPGGLGSPDPVRVTGGASAGLYRDLTGAVDGAPGWAATALEAATEAGLVALGLLVVWLGWTGLRRGDARRLAGAVLTVLGTVVAYAGSEALKLAVDEERPCRALADAAAPLAHCPPPGDWSFPSNHATLAAALAAGLVCARPRLAAVALPVAAATAALRVLTGVHYPHDVLAGAALGGAIAVAGAMLGGPPLTALLSRRLPAPAGIRVPPRGPRRPPRPGSGHRGGTGSS